MKTQFPESDPKAEKLNSLFPHAKKKKKKKKTQINKKTNTKTKQKNNIAPLFPINNQEYETQHIGNHANLQNTKIKIR
jgi:hypothetical protein